MVIDRKVVKESWLSYKIITVGLYSEELLVVCLELLFETFKFLEEGQDFEGACEIEKFDLNL